MGKKAMPKKNKKNKKEKEIEISDSDHNTDSESESDNEVEIKEKVKVTATIKNLDKDESDGSDNDNTDAESDDESNDSSSKDDKKSVRKKYSGIELNNLYLDQKELINKMKKDLSDKEKLIESKEKEVKELRSQYKKDVHSFFKEIATFEHLFSKSESIRMHFEEAKLWSKKICNFVGISETEEKSFVDMQKLCMDKFKSLPEIGMEGKYINTKSDHKYLKIFNIDQDEKVTSQTFSQKLSKVSK